MHRKSSQKGRITQKQLAKIPLFKNVKHINGQKIFKMLYQTCKIVTYEIRTADKQLSLKQNFIYVKEGQILVYKQQNRNYQNYNSTKTANTDTIDNNNSLYATKSLLKSYRNDQYCGFQDYPLFWNQELVIQVNPGTTLIVVPLQLFYKLFRRVIPMTYLQSKAQYLKKLPLFRGVQLQKIFRLACLSQKYHISKNKIFIRQGQRIQNVVIICGGKVELTSSVISEVLTCSQNQDFLVKQLRQDIQFSLFTARCIQQADLLVIPKNQFKKIYDIRQKLNEKQTLQIQKSLDNKQKQMTSINKQNEEVERQISQFQKSQFEFQETQNKRRYHTVYGKSLYSRVIGQQSILKSRRGTLSIQKQKQGYTQKQRTYTNASDLQKQIKYKQTNYSLGQIQLIKFVRRKQKVENRNFFRYIQSRAPQIVLNPSKQFALIKPLYKSSSQYVRNMKRKIKRSVNISNTPAVVKSLNNFLL